MTGVSEGRRCRQERGFCELSEAITRARTIAICAHMSPDGDALGSELSLAAIIRERWPEKRVHCLLAEHKEVPRHLRFLPMIDELVPPREAPEAPDLFIAVDLSVASRLADARATMERAREVFVIDHHPTKRPFGDGAIMRPDVAACGVVILEYALYLDAAVTRDVAMLLFCAIMTDTGRFQYQNANAEAFWAAGKLVAAGADPSVVALNVYQSMRLSYLRLESVVMGRITTLLDGRIAFSWVFWEDFEATGAGEDESEGLVDIVRSVEGAEVALLLRETPEGAIRGNLRSKSEIDVSGLATELGGGGHAAAAGFSLGKVSLEAAKETVLPKLEALVLGG